MGPQQDIQDRRLTIIETRAGAAASVRQSDQACARTNALHAFAAARRTMRVRIFLTTALIAALATGVQPALAQNYPSKPIRLIVPYPPGGNTDIMARALTQELSKGLGQPVVIDNRGGAATVIGSDILAKAAPDGYTLILSTSSHAINVSLYRKLPFDAVADFAPISLVASMPNILVVNPSVPVKSLSELIKLAKAKPGQINYSSSGNGATNHLAMELLKTMAGIEMVHIPYKGTADAVTSLLGGQVSVMFDAASSALPHIRSGRSRALAVSSPGRIASLPDLPTVAEAGLPGFEVGVWFGIQAPAGTPPEIVKRLNSEILRSLGVAEVRERLAGLGVDIVSSTPEEFAAFVKTEIAKWGKVVKDSGARID
jgi:tripartite-type tricarboxylate transporter receptor subunit TctC